MGCDFVSCVFTRVAMITCPSETESMSFTRRTLASKKASGGTSVLQRDVPTFSHLGICVFFVRRISCAISYVPVIEQANRRQSRDAFCFSALVILTQTT